MLIGICCSRIEVRGALQKFDLRLDFHLIFNCKQMSFESENGLNEQSITQIPEGSVVEDRASGMGTVVALSAALVLSGCSATTENLSTCEDTAPLKAKISELQGEVRSLQDKAIENNTAGIYTFGTLGAKWLRPGRDNRLRVAKNFTGTVDQTFVFWPLLMKQEDLKFFEQPQGIEVIPFGDNFAVRFRNEMEDKPKIVFAMDVGGERFVVTFERR